MRIAVLPFNAADGTKPAIGRQYAAFAAEQLRVHAGADINTVSYLTQIPSEDGQQRTAFVNISDDLLPFEQLKDLFEQAQVELIQDGVLRTTDDGFSLTLRYHRKDNPEPVSLETIDFKPSELFSTLHALVKKLAHQAEIGLPEFLSGEQMEFGTDDPEAFLNFLEGYDALSYIQQANGQVALEFSPEPAMNSLVAAIEADVDFEGPYQVLIRLCQASAHFRIGTFEMIDKSLSRAIALVPDEPGAYFGFGDCYQSIGNLVKASEYFEKAVQLDPKDPALYTRLGQVQMQLEMPVNAERNFRRAMDLEGPDKPSADFLAAVLTQTHRAHEVPKIWKSIIDANPQNGQAQAKYAISLIQAGRPAEGEQAFDNALEILEDSTVVKRYFAPVLAKKGELDRAMDFYEDVLDVAPNDVPTLLEYAQTLTAAGREFEVPNVLKTVLASNPDINVRAQTMARLIELEQPKRVESVESARQKLVAEDFHGAIRELKPLRNWLADYWKLWAMLAAAYNKTEQYEEAQEAAKRVLEMFPGCEPAYKEFFEALTGQNKNAEAYEFIRHAAINNPSSLPIHLSLGLAAKRIGNFEEARSLAKQIREATEDDPELAAVLTEMESPA